MEVLWRSLAVQDEHHKAFTDLILWQGRHWLVYREGDSHAGGPGRVMLTSSLDEGETWSVPAPVMAEPLDSRDPKLWVLGGRLWCSAIVWPGPAGVEFKQSSWVTSTADGSRWSEPQPILGPPSTLWRPVARAGRLYAAVYHAPGPPNSPEDRGRWDVCLAISEDGQNWREWAEIATGDAANETQVAFIPSVEGAGWHPDTMLAVVRREAAPEAYTTLVMRSEPPYTDWNQVADMGVTLHAPCMAWVGERLILAGRLWEPIVAEDGSGQWQESLAAYEWRDGGFSEIGRIWDPLPGVDARYVGIAPVGDTGDEVLVSTYIGIPDGKADIWVAKVRFGGDG